MSSPAALPAYPELTARVALRYADVNAAGHVANTSVPVLFEEGRVRTLGFHEGTGDDLPRGLFALAGPDVRTLVGQVTTEYHREIFYRGQEVEIRSWVSGIGTSRFALSAALLDDGVVAAVSDCVVVVIDASTGRPTPLPEPLRSRLASLTAPAVPLRDRLTAL